MLIDCSRTAPPETLETEVAIIGSGAAGITLALTLESLGVRAIVVEAGGDGFDKAGQQFYRAASIEPASHGPTHMYRRRAFGGTTAIWGGRCIPFDPIDFEDRPWLPHARWPIGYDDVARHYPRAMEICRAGPAQFTAGEVFPDEQAPIVEGVRSADLILDRLERFSEPTHFGRAYGDRLKTSSLVTVLTHAAVIDIRTTEDGNLCTGLTARTTGGATIQIDARHTVVAAGGLETPRLLLAARNARECGLGNERDMVGRFYQAHIEGEIGMLRFKRPPAQVRLDYERSPEGIYCRRYMWISPEAQRREQLAGVNLRPGHANIVDPDHRDPVLSAMYLVKGFILPEYARKLTSSERRVRDAFEERGRPLMAAHIANIARRPLRIAGFSLDWARRRVFASRKLPSVVLRDPRNAYPVEVNAEQVPDPESRVMLSGEKDDFGMPRIVVQWRMSDDDRARVARSLHLVAKTLGEAGVAEFDLGALDQQLGELTRVGGHHIGTARMASDPAIGVVDANSETFGTRNLFVAGAATFATSGFANPTLTVVALSIRLGEHLAKLSRERSAAA